MPRNFRTAFGLLLITAGVLLTLQRLDIIGGEWENAVLTVVYGLGFVYFASIFQADRSRWWAALVTFILLGVTLANLLEIFLPGQFDSFIGSLVLFLIGVGFLSVYIANRMMWWAIIPAGVLFSLTGVSYFEESPAQLGFEPAGILFIGLGLTFLVLYFLRVDGPRLSWAIYPAIVLVVFGLFIGFEQQEVWNLIWPSLIILLGIYILAGSLRRKTDA